MPGSSSNLARLALTLVAALSVITGCADSPGPTDLASDREATFEGASEMVATMSLSLDFWPYTGTRADMSSATDPINLIFTGKAHPLDIRAALMSLDGQRPPTLPDCTWEDAMGAVQTSHSGAGGWTGSVVQLQCGSYASQRFHVRLFEMDGQTLGAAHGDVLIPETPNHFAFTWEDAEAFVVFDMARTGLLGAPPSSTPIINDPMYRGLPSDGMATVLDLTGSAPRQLGVRKQTLTLSFGRVIPRPFCSQGPTDLVLADGPITLTGRFHETTGGTFQAHFSAEGQLALTPFDIGTGQPSGDTYRAHVKEDHDGQIAARGIKAGRSLQQTELPQGVRGRARLTERMAVGTNIEPYFRRNENCR
jgi:hypothetical protein